eukprot:gene14209-31517_t
MPWTFCCLGRTSTPDDEDADENEVVFIAAQDAARSAQLQELDGMLYAHVVAPSGCTADDWIAAVSAASSGNLIDALHCLKTERKTAQAILELMLQTYGMFHPTAGTDIGMGTCALPESNGAAVGSSLDASEPRMWAFFFLAWELAIGDLNAPGGGAGAGQKKLVATRMLGPYHDCATKHAPSRGFFGRALLVHEQAAKYGVDSAGVDDRLDNDHEHLGFMDRASILQKLMREEHGNFFMTVSRASKVILAWIGRTCGDEDLGISSSPSGGSLSIARINNKVENCLKYRLSLMVILTAPDLVNDSGPLKVFKQNFGLMEKSADCCLVVCPSVCPAMIALLFGGSMDGDHNYQLSNLRLCFMSMPDASAKAKVMMRTKLNI